MKILQDILLLVQRRSQISCYRMVLELGLASKKRSRWRMSNHELQEFVYVLPSVEF